MLGVGVILDIFSYKYHKLAAILYIYEGAYLFLSHCIIIDKGVYGAFITFASLLTYNFTLGCQAGICTISSTLLYFFIEFTIDSSSDDDDANDLKYLVYYRVLYLFSLFFFSTLGFLAINWALKLYDKQNSQ